MGDALQLNMRHEIPENCKIPAYEVEQLVYWMGLNESNLIIEMAVNADDMHVVGSYT